jgi:hypothetical protein
MHQDDNPKFLDDLHERIDDSLDSIRAIKGDRFADIVYVSFMGAHAMKMVGTYMSKQKGESMAREMIGRQLGHSIAAFMAMIAELAKLTEDDCKELMNWSDTLCEHVNTALKEAE